MILLQEVTPGPTYICTFNFVQGSYTTAYGATLWLQSEAFNKHILSLVTN